MEYKSINNIYLMKFQKIFHYFNFVTTFAVFIKIVFVITKAGGNRPIESLATLLL